ADRRPAPVGPGRDAVLRRFRHVDGHRPRRRRGRRSPRRPSAGRARRDQGRPGRHQPSPCRPRRRGGRPGRRRSRPLGCGLVAGTPGGRRHRRRSPPDPLDGGRAVVLLPLVLLPLVLLPLVLLPLVLLPLVLVPLVGGVVVWRDGAVRRRILALAGAYVALGLLVVLRTPTPVGVRTTPIEFIGFTAAFALVGSLPIHLELRRGSLDVVLDEAVWVVGLFALTPTGLVLAVVAGDALSRLVSRQPPVKTAYNLATAFLATAIGASTGAVIGLGGPATPGSWLATAVAMTAMAGTSLVCISAVLAMVEGRRLWEVLRHSAGSLALSTAANASIGLAVVVLLQAAPAGPLILAPLVVPVVLASRRQAQQAADQLRFER